MFNDIFPAQRPLWLINARGHQMELDGYCQKLNLAFEYQGEQHFSIFLFFSKNMV